MEPPPLENTHQRRDLAALLATLKPAIVGNDRFGRLDLRLATYVDATAPLPADLVGSVRCVVRVGNRVVTCRTALGLHVVPGGRPEAGETHVQTACREVHEETGWLLDESTVERIGFLHFQHTTPKPADYTYLYPDFLQVVYTGTADSRDESQGEAWTDVEGWELGNDLYTLAELKSVEIDPTQRPFLDRIARLL